MCRKNRNKKNSGLDTQTKILGRLLPLLLRLDFHHNPLCCRWSPCHFSSSDLEKLGKLFVSFLEWPGPAYNDAVMSQQIKYHVNGPNSLLFDRNVWSLRQFVLKWFSTFGLQTENVNGCLDASTQRTTEKLSAKEFPMVHNFSPTPRNREKRPSSFHTERNDKKHHLKSQGCFFELFNRTTGKRWKAGKLIDVQWNQLIPWGGGIYRWFLPVN